MLKGWGEKVSHTMIIGRKARRESSASNLFLEGKDSASLAEEYENEEFLDNAHIGIEAEGRKIR